MRYKLLQKVVVVANPASGLELPVLAHLNTAFRRYEIEWELYITKKKGDGAALDQIKKVRSFIRPTRPQLKQLKKFEKIMQGI